MVETQVAALDVLALGRRRLGLDHAGDHGGGVVHQLVGRERILPTGTCTSAVLSVRNSTLPALIFLHRVGDVEGHRTGLRVRHQATRAEHLTQLTDRLIMSGVAIRASKSVQFSFWIFSTISSPPTKSAPAASASRSFSPRGDDQHLLRLAQSVRQNHRAAHHLVGVLGIDAQTQREFHRLVELGELHFLQKRDRVLQSVYGRCSTAVRAFSIFFPDFFMSFSLSPTASSATVLQAVVIIRLVPIRSPALQTSYADDFDAHRPRRALDRS